MDASGEGLMNLLSYLERWVNFGSEDACSAALAYAKTLNRDPAPLLPPSMESCKWAVSTQLISPCTSSIRLASPPRHSYSTYSSTSRPVGWSLKNGKISGTQALQRVSPAPLTSSSSGWSFPQWAHTTYWKTNLHFSNEKWIFRK